MAAVTKEITFDCAHMLAEHDGLCANLHGHTYRLRLTVGGEIGADGMVADFAEIKAFLREIADEWDHAIIFAAVRGEAEDALLGWAEKYNKRRFVMPSGNPTAENMAQYVLAEAAKRFAGFSDCRVRLWETPTAFAEVCAEVRA
jgi:6-pyruvoyltetrahydropterin/6-carboxytetrahydropterin synthase